MLCTFSFLCSQFRFLLEYESNDCFFHGFPSALSGDQYFAWPTEKSKPLSIHLNIFVSLLLATFLTCDLKTGHETTNLSSRASSLLGSTLLVHLGPALLTLLVSLLFLGKWLDLIGVEDALLAALSPVVVAGVVVKDLLVEEISGLSQDLGFASCSTSLSAR
jgi:hypothetical protein